MPANRQLAAILFTDIEGYTAFMRCMILIFFG
jgi:hypothetical protein